LGRDERRHPCSIINLAVQNGIAGIWYSYAVGHPVSARLRHGFAERGGFLRRLPDEARSPLRTASSRSREYVTVGFHPYFAVGDKAALRWQIPSQAYTIKDQEGVYPFTGSFDWSQPELDYLFPTLSNTTALVEDEHTHLRLDWDPQFQCLVLWTVHNKPFYCLEPWSSPRHALNTGEKLLRLSPGESCQCQLKLTGILKK